jgi:FeS assembly SUF system regulator
MIRIAKLTDYAIVLLTYIARNGKRDVHAARDLAAESHLPVPTVSKILKCLARGGLLVSHRGVAGGYSLAKAAGTINIAEVIAVMEGPVALTECSTSCPGLCEIERVCPVRNNWRKINDVVRRSLENVTLLDMTQPLPKPSREPARHSGGRLHLRLMAKR